MIHLNDYLHDDQFLGSFPKLSVQSPGHSFSSFCPFFIALTHLLIFCSLARPAFQLSSVWRMFRPGARTRQTRTWQKLYIFQFLHRDIVRGPGTVRPDGSAFDSGTIHADDDDTSAHRRCSAGDSPTGGNFTVIISNPAASFGHKFNYLKWFN